MRFISRSDMGWPASAARPQPFDPDGVKVHYEGEAFPGFPHSQCIAHWTGIRNSHLANKVENYADVAYNLAVCQHGYVLEGRGAGRQTGANGNQELNGKHYAICVLIGGNTEPSPEAVGALREAIQYLRQRGAGNEIKGHRDGFATSCPGTPLYNLVKSGALEPSREDDMEPVDVWAYKGTGERLDSYGFLVTTAKAVAALSAKVDKLETNGLTAAQITAIANAVADVQAKRLAS